MKKLLISLAILSLTGTVGAAQWVKNHTQCVVEYQSQNCAFAGQAACGYTNDTLYCAYSTAVNGAIPSANSTANSTIRNAILGGGYVIDCLAAASTCLPWECQADSSCVIQNRQTTCLAGTNNFSCGTCQTNYYDCNTTNPTCEVNTGSIGPYPNTVYSGGCASTGASGVGNVQCSNNYLACDGTMTDVDGCEVQKNTTPYLENGYVLADNVVYGDTCASTSVVCEIDYCNMDGNISAGNGCEVPSGATCTTSGGMPGILNFDSQTSCSCVEAPTEYFETGGFENTRPNRYTTTNPLLWGEQLGDGELIEIISTYTNGGGFRVLNTGAVEVSDDNGTTWVPLSEAAGDNLGNHIATENIQMSDFWVSNDGDNEGLFVDANGNVGIGIDTPTAALELPAGTTTVAPFKLGVGGALLSSVENGALEFDDANLYFTFAGTRQILATQDYVNTQISSIATDNITADDSNVTVVDTGLSGIITFSTDGAEQMRVTSLGNVGIGITNPNEKLHVSGGIVVADHESATPVAGTIEWNTTDSQFKGYDGTDWVALDSQGKSPAGAAGSIQFTDGTDFVSDDANLFWDDTNDRLGVGTDTPAEALEVAGAVKVGTTTTANEGTIRYEGGFEGYDGVQWVALDSQGNGKWVDATTPGDIYYSAGNVGVGTNDPQAPLDVQGMIRTSSVTDKGNCQSANDVGKIAYESVETPPLSGNYVGTWYGCKQIGGAMGSISSIDYLWVQLEIFGR